MKALSLTVKIGITAVLALVAFYFPIVLMICAAKFILGWTQLSDTQLFFTLLAMVVISFVFCCWLDTKLKVYNTISSLVDKVIKKHAVA